MFMTKLDTRTRRDSNTQVRKVNSITKCGFKHTHEETQEAAVCLLAKYETVAFANMYIKCTVSTDTHTQTCAYTLSIFTRKRHQRMHEK